MTSVQAARLACPGCGRNHHALSWRDDRHAQCFFCRTDFEVFPLAAWTQQRATAKPVAVQVTADSTCYHHAGNAAETLCDHCGKFLCSVCAVPGFTQTLCPPCLSAKMKTDSLYIPNRTLWGSASFSLALITLLLVFAWPISIVTAPSALIVAIIGWKKPDSLVRSTRWKLILGGSFGLLFTAGWAFMIFFIFTQLRK